MGKGIGKTVILLLLLINTVTDIRRREISLACTLGAFAAGAACRFLWINTQGGPPPGIPAPWFSAVPGLLFLLLAGISRGKVGAGDGLVVLAAGAWTEAEPLLRTCMAAFVMVLLAECLTRMFRKPRKEWPFMPFLCIAWILCGFQAA